MLRKGQKAYLPFKRTIDIFGSVLGIIILSPLLLVASIVTKCTSKGPIIFKQERLGKNEKVFKIYKFRSMRIDAPANVGQDDITEEEKTKLTTKWGRFMRKTSIDELPQLFNILKGDMSFIGPRPMIPEKFEPELYKARKSTNPSAFEVKQGLSGYAQINNKRSSEIKTKAEADSYYVAHMSFWFDLKLFFISILVLFGYNRGK